MTADTNDETNAVNLDSLLNLEYIHMYMKIADAARVQVSIC